MFVNSSPTVLCECRRNAVHGTLGCPHCYLKLGQPSYQMRNHTQISDILLECASCHCPTVFCLGVQRERVRTRANLESHDWQIHQSKHTGNVFCSVVLCSIVLCCAPLCCVVLRCAPLCCAPLCCATLLCCVRCCVVLRCCVVSVVVLCSVVLCCAPLCCLPLCCAPLCYHEKSSFLIYIWI